MRLRAQHLLALDASAAAGAVVASGLGGRRLQASARVALPPSALLPRAQGTNLLQPEAVSAALEGACRQLGGLRRAVLLLPGAVAWTLAIDLPEGTEAREHARYRLAGVLPYPIAEALVDVAPLGPGRALAAAVRRAVVEEYEAAARRAGLEVERLDLTPLAALTALAAGLRADAPWTAVVLEDGSAAVAVLRDGRLESHRARLRAPRDPDDLVRLGEEVRRAGRGAPARVVGPGAPALVAELRAGGSAELGWSLSGPGGEHAPEMAWLGAALGA